MIQDNEVIQLHLYTFKFQEKIAITKIIHNTTTAIVLDFLNCDIEK